jgi:prepilin-type N-terminal cleavage/methylation domain-containing protein
MKNKNSEQRRYGNRGFTLLELMVVISLIAILAGMVLAAMPAVVNSVKRKETKLSLKEMEAGLSSYHLDNGMFPVHAGDPVEGAFVLYKHLSGDFDEDGILDDVSAKTKIYVEGIDWNTSKNQKRDRVGDVGGRYALLDPFGSPIRYLCDPPGQKKKITRNPTYDIWSLGGGDSDSDALEDRSKWLTNWE